MNFSLYYSKLFLFIVGVHLLCPLYLKAENIKIQSSHLSMRVEINKSKGAFLSSLKNTSDSDFLQLEEKQTLFKLSVAAGEQKELYTVTSDKGWKQVDVQKEEGSYYFTFSGYKLAPDCENLRISFSVTPKTTGTKFYNSSTIHVSWADCTFPREIKLLNATLLPLTLKNLASKTKAFYPCSSGIVCDPNKEKITMDMRYPSGFGASMPWFAVWNAEEKGLYIAAHDKNATLKDLSFISDATGGVSFSFTYPSIKEENGSSNLAPCKIVLTAYDGDWFDAAMLYKEWAKNEASWYPRSLMGAEGREDTPKWMKELCVWAVGGDQQVEEFQKALGVPIGFHWYQWHEIPFDNDYPHYFPAKPDFAKKVKLLQKRNIYVMPYINGRLWDSHDKGTLDSLFTKEALPAVTKKESGEPIIESYGSKESDESDVKLGVMCPSTDRWKDKMKEVVLTLLDPKNGYGTKAVYMDQIAAAPPVECFDRTHPHPLGGGDWWTLSYRSLLSNIRQSKPDGTILTTESNADGYVDGFDGFLVWQFQHNNQVPAFAAVYGGAIQLFGRNYGEDASILTSKMKMAQSFVFGEQLGWIDASVLQVAEKFVFLKKLVTLRYKFKEYFYKGEMCKSPLLEGDNPVLFTGNFYDIANTAVQCGAWRIPNQHKMILMFANYSSKPITLDVKYPLKNWDTKMEKAKMCQYNTDGTLQVLDKLPKSITIAPDDAFVIEVYQ